MQVFNITTHCVSQMVSRGAKGRPSIFLSSGWSTCTFIRPVDCLLLSEEYNFVKFDAIVPSRKNSFTFNIVNYKSLLTIKTSLTSFRNFHHLRWNCGFFDCGAIKRVGGHQCCGRVRKSVPKSRE